MCESLLLLVAMKSFRMIGQAVRPTDRSSFAFVFPLHYVCDSVNIAATVTDDDATVLISFLCQ